MTKSLVRRSVAAFAMTAAVLMGLSVLGVGASLIGAGTASAGKLPGGYLKKSLVDGTTVQARLYDESVTYLAGTVASMPTSREVWLSGKFAVKLSGDDVKGAVVNGGYVVGCQIDLHGIRGRGDGVIDENGLNRGKSGPSAGLSIGPGRARYVPIIRTTSGDYTNYADYNTNSYTFKGKRGGIAYSQESFRIDGCAGYASARARFQVKVNTAAVKGVIQVWGKPFSIG